ncbi:carboxymuconolactone decarboxylase family protein [Saccharopolyspora flava]|uniref:Alkylhydroperoxidase family enzyme, contains CxxC motif n=1 Tax=Saccharopolyspora flava TaxID=95161 RepID=A0A1I6TVU3_9PSEU|nr:carboxymuconolactone decarboxylase family protein [Saccharopolyspora flava]SFS93228.1 Alkylhydroperoxidase family enzyme, contains CxxC motif [Saccharopolyspora flava]
MPRIPAVPTSEANLLTRLTYKFSRRRYGAVLDPLTVVAHHPGLLMAVGVSEMAVEKAATSLPANLRDLAIYKVSTKIGCSWCVDFGVMLQRNEGLDVERLKHIDDYRDSEAYSELEKLVLAYADAMTEQPMQVTDEQVAELDRRLGHKGMVELTHMISVENQRTRFNHALGLTAQGFTSGEACKVPMP